MNKLTILFFPLGLGFWCLGFGTWNLGLGASNVDSLSARLRQTLHDTDRINTLNDLGWELMYTNPDTAIILSTQALEILNSKFQIWAPSKNQT